MGEFEDRVQAELDVALDRSVTELPKWRGSRSRRYVASN